MAQHDGPVTDPTFARTAASPSDAAPSTLGAVLNLGGIVAVALLLWQAGILTQPLWVVVLAGAGLLGWLLRELLPARSPLQLVAALAAVVASSAVAVPTSVTGYIAGLVCLAALLAAPARPLALGLASAVGSALLVAVGALLGGVDVGFLLGSGAGLAIAVLVGVSRRQSRAASARERELLEERVRFEEERARTAALAERSRIARDIHDVLAHSLGGLVLQLDAVDALLESGRVDEAHVRVASARALAASGLDEARRAVDALRDPETATDLRAALAELLATHRSLGAQATLAAVRTGPPRSMTPEAAGALRRAAQEALTNARRHAPGRQTDLTLTEESDVTALVASTPLAHDPASVGAELGGGRGLTGLQERVTALGGTAQWGVRDGAFVVTATVPSGPPSTTELPT